jgi:hypothetical protein
MWKGCPIQPDEKSSGLKRPFKAGGFALPAKLGPCGWAKRAKKEGIEKGQKIAPILWPS